MLPRYSRAKSTEAHCNFNLFKIEIMKFNLIKASALLLSVLAIGIYSGCKPEKIGEGNGLVAKNNGSFSINPVAGKPNNFVLQADETGVLGVKWDLGDGGGSNPGIAIDSIFVPDAGTYNITLTTVGVGGVSKTVSKMLTVATSDPKAGNKVLGGKMGAGDDQYWTHFIVGSGTNMVLDPSKGVMVANETGYQAGAIYQSFNLTAGQKYSVDMIVSGSGATNSWFEVWVDTLKPTNGNDYNTGQKPISLNTFAGCGIGPFNGKLSALSCSGSGDPFTVPTTGTYYLVIKCGGQDTGLTGISFTNVTLRGVN
jgi:hypothetical protein